MKRILKKWRDLSKRNRRLIQLGTAFVVYSLVGFFLVPAIVKSQLLKRLPGITKRQAAVREVRCNPYVLSLTIRGLMLTETNGLPFASWEELYVNFQLSSLFRWAWTFDEIKLKDPYGQVILGKDGRFNFANMFVPADPAPPAPPAKESTIPRVLIFSLSITNGNVAFADLNRRTPFRTSYRPINLKLTRFATHPDAETPLAFAAESDTGRSVAWSGNLTVQPLRSSGTLRVTGIQLVKHAPYIEDFTHAEVAEGLLDFSANYRLALGTNGLDLVATNVSLTLTNLQMKDPQTGEIVVKVPWYELNEGYANYQARDARVGSVKLHDPFALVRRRADGSINLPSLIVNRMLSAAATNAAPVKEEAPWNFALDDYQIERGEIALEDAAVPGSFKTLIKPLSMHIQHFNTRLESNATLRVELTTDAAESVTLASTYCINPVRAHGSLDVRGVDLKRYQPYLLPFFRGEITGGKSNLKLDFQHRLQGGAHRAGVSNVSLLVSDLQITSPDPRETVVTVPELAIENTTASVPEMAVRVGAVRSRGARILARRGADGAINLLQLLPPTAQSSGETNRAPTAPPPPAGTHPTPAGGLAVQLDEFALSDYTIQFEDKTTPKPAALKLDQLSLKLAHAAFPSNAPVKTEVQTRVNELGTVAARGTARLYTPSADLEVEVAGLDLRAFQPYANQFVRLNLASGRLNTRGQARYSPGAAGDPLLRFTGTVGVTNFLATDQVLFKEFVRWNDLAVSGVDFALQPDRLEIAEVKWAGLKTSILIGPDKQPNLKTILPAPPAADTNAPAMVATPTAPAAGKERIPFLLPKFILQDASFHFADQSIEPNCVFDIQDFSGTISGLSSELNSTATVDIRGRMDEQGPFAVSGKVNPLAKDLMVDLTISNSNVQLTPFTPYLEKYGGYPLNKGKLSTALRYEIHQKSLKAQNKVMIDQLTLGARNTSPDATKLPVKLAVALLKDRNGRIELDVPLTGQIDDPKFKLGPIILKVFMNVLAKAVTSPFALLGALVGGGGEELSYVDFAPGQSEVGAAEAQKLDKLAKALFERPALSLEIAALVDPAKDRDVLARLALHEKIKAMRLKELADAGTPVPAPDQFQLETNDYTRLIIAAYEQAFGTNDLLNVSTNLTTTNVTVALPKAAATNQVAARPAAVPAVAVAQSVPPAKPIPPAKGAQRLIWRESARTTAAAAPAAATKPAPAAGPTRPAAGRGAGTASGKTPPAPTAVAAPPDEGPVVAAVTLEAMEARLAGQIEVSENQLRELMQQRAQAVQAYLLKTEKVTAERLFILAPKPLGSFRGETRVNLSLN